MTDVNNEQRESFNALLRPHLDRLYRFACRLCASRADAEDLFQDVLTKVFARLDELVDIQQPGPWLCRILYNHFVDNQRRFGRQRLVIVEEAALAGNSVEAFAGGLDPVADAERGDTIMQMQRALASLSDEQRLVVMLHDCEGYKFVEIQAITGDPVGTLKSRLHRARARLRELLTTDGTISDAAACND